MSTDVILSTAYLAPVQYYSKLLSYENIHIEIHENFIKQSYRNRCVIYGANGAMSLSIPIKKLSPKTIIKDLLIDYDTKWQKLHWKSIESAYRSSPFFEFYEDDLKPYYQKKIKFLLDFNNQLQEVILENLGVKANITQTTDYVNEHVIEYDDFRYIIHPKKKIQDISFELPRYTQVFQDKFDFIPDLSDLLFNEGPNSINFLK